MELLVRQKKVTKTPEIVGVFATEINDDPSECKL